VLVVAVLMVSYASSLRAYIQQRQELAGLRSDIASSQANIASLQREKKRWSDPAYVRAQARQRFGWVLPGEVGFRVLDTDGRPLGADSSLDGPAAKQQENGPTWYESGWASIVAAGTPEDQKPKPVTTIRAPVIPKQ
jgi:hypothetical protein